MNPRRFIILAVLTAALIVAPVFAGAKYMSGEPDLTAAISGPNEFSPGQDAVIPVKIENRGLIDYKFVLPGIMERDDLPNTAKMVRVTLDAGDAPIVVRSDSQMIGDIQGGNNIQSQFNVKILQDAHAGEYFLPMALSYTYLARAEQMGQDSIQYFYKQKNVTIGLPITIRPKAAVDVVEVTPEALNVGTEGYVRLLVRNGGSEDARSAVLKLARSGNSPLIPTDSTVYIGDFPTNGTAECRFKTSVSQDAEGQAYPLDLLLSYVNRDGDTVTSETVTIGVPIGGKIDFEVIPVMNELVPGEKKIVEVIYRNTGAATAYAALARISAVDPFTSSDDTAFLGDIGPGGEATARYEVSVDAGATTKQYGIDSEIRYRDSLENSQISDTLKVQLTVIPQNGLPLLIGIVIVVGIAACGAYYFFAYRKKK